MIKFNSPFNPIRVEPTDTSKRTISGDYLDYNEFGKVVVKHSSDIDLMEISEAAKEGTELSEQIARMTREGTLENAILRESDCGDVSNAPSCLTEALQNKAVAIREAEKLDNDLKKYDLGITGKDLASKTDEEINKILNDYIEKRINKKEVIEDGKQ